MRRAFWQRKEFASEGAACWWGQGRDPRRHTGQVGLALTLKEAHDGRGAQGSDVAICHLGVWAICWET